MTYTQDASKQCLRITLRELGIDEDCTYISPDNRQWSDIVDFLVIHTPTFQSHLGIKFDEYEKLNNHNLDTFIKKILALDGI